MRQRRKPPRDYEDDEESFGDNLAAVSERLDDLTRQLERVARSNAEAHRRTRAAEDDRSQDRVAEAVARLDRRLDEVIAEGRAQSAAFRRRQTAAPPPPAVNYAPPPHAAPHYVPPVAPQPAPAPPLQPSGPAAWAQEISARQRALDGEPAPARSGGWRGLAAPHPAPQPVQVPAPDLSGLENHLRQITDQIATLHQPYEDALTALRGDLAAIGRSLTDALPRRAIEALETEIRTLAERVGRTRSSGGGVSPEALAGIEQGLAEVRDALTHMKPAESLAGIDEAVRGLSQKIDQIAMNSGHDPAQFQQIEHAIGSLRGLVSNVASDGALSQLAAEVHNLARHLEHSAAQSGGEALARLDARIAQMMESGRSVPPELEASIRGLSDQLARAQLSQSDQFALGALESRIAQLFEKLDASEARLGSLSAIERGMADLMLAVEEIRSGSGARGPRAAPPEVRPQIEPAPQAQPAAAIEPAPQPPAVYRPEPTRAVAPSAQAMAHQAPPQPPRPAPPPRVERQPINPNLPPDTPLEPGAGAPRVKPGSPAARIAASEAALGPARPASEPPAKPLAAARTAAKSAIAEAPPPAAKPRAKAFELTEEDLEATSAGRSRFGGIGKHIKTLLIAASVVAIVVVSLQTAMDFFLAPSEQTAPARSDAPQSTAPSSGGPASAPGRAMPQPDDASAPPAPAPAAQDPDTTGTIRQPQLFDPNTVLPSLPADVTGSVGRPRASRPAPAAQEAPSDALPASFGPILRSAAGSGDAAAIYEVGQRYAEGRGVPANLTTAARWFDRAAKAGFVPAQFRLASMNEKGEGLPKDTQTALKLYTAAADKGHAKAMHNLAVLYAEGVTGKPDYRMAAQWFRRAAGYGVPDSQYNLAILYARGIGVQQNLAESYKWFALAAAGGDQDATRKRDDVAGRLDRSTLMAARLAAQTFTPEREPDEATALRVPPGGWDRTPAAAAQPSKPARRPAQ